MDGMVHLNGHGSELSVQLLSIETVTRFGMQNYPSLVLRGKMRAATCCWPRITRTGIPIPFKVATGRNRQIWQPGFVPFNTLGSIATITFDDEHDIAEDVDLLEIFKDSLMVLAVQSTEKGEYRRLGIGPISFKGWFDRCVEQTFVLI